MTIHGSERIAALVLLAGYGSWAFAHGVMQNPPARNWFCGADTAPEVALYGVPEFPACAAAFSGENEALNYEFMSVLSHTQGRSMVSPLPQNVCGFDSESFGSGRTPWDKPVDWPTSDMSPGRNKITWNISWGPHFSDTEEFRYWITKPGFRFEVGKPLSWSDLEESPFCVLDYDDANPSANPDVVARKATTQFDTYCTVPVRNGRQVIYGEWGRNYYTYERFHGCLDVTFAGSASVTPQTVAVAPEPIAVPEAEPTAQPVAEHSAEPTPDTTPETPAVAELEPEAEPDTTAELSPAPFDVEEPPTDPGVAPVNDQEPASVATDDVGSDVPLPTGNEESGSVVAELFSPPGTEAPAPENPAELPTTEESVERVVARITTKLADATFVGAGTITMSAAQSSGESLSYRWSLDADNSDLYSLNNATSESASLLLAAPETSGSITLALNVTGASGSDSTVLALKHEPEVPATPDRIDLGAVTAVSRDLQIGDRVSIRLVLDSGDDVFYPLPPVRIAGATQAAAAWPRALAVAVNRVTDTIDVGALDPNGGIDPASDATANRIYASTTRGIASAFLIVDKVAPILADDQSVMQPGVGVEAPLAPVSEALTAPDSPVPVGQPEPASPQFAGETPVITATPFATDSDVPSVAESGIREIAEARSPNDVADESSMTADSTSATGAIDLYYLLVLTIAVVWVGRLRKDANAPRGSPGRL